MRKLAALPLALFLLGGVAAAQATGSYKPFGKSGLFEPVHSPGIEASATPRIGKSFTVYYTGTYNTYATYHFLVSGISNRRWGNHPLPLTIDSRWFSRTSLTPGSTLLVSIDHIGSGFLPFPNTGRFGITHAVPNSSALLGLTFYQQWVIYGMGAYPVHNFLQTTCGAMCVIGR